MASYQDIKKLDEESLQQLKEGSGPSDQCICNLLSPPEKKGFGFGSSLKKAFGMSKLSKKGRGGVPQNSIVVPLNFGAGNHSTKEVIRRKSSCGKCGCDDNPTVLRHSYANIRITSPDISSVCPCSADCLPDKEKLKTNIKVTVERAQVDLQPLSAQSDQNIALSESQSVESKNNASNDN